MEAGILYTVKNTIIQAFLAFPYMMIWFIGFLALGLGNLGLFILFVGQTIILPLIVVLVHTIIDWKIPVKPDADPFRIRIGPDIISKAQVVPIYSRNTTVNVSPSFWMAQTLFLLGYLLGNTIAVLNLPNDSNVDNILLQNRKSRANTVMAVTLFFTVVLSVLRYQTNTETPYGMGFALVIGGLGGYLWYLFAETCGVRTADVFGIAQQVVIPSRASDERPMTCVYNPKP